MTAPERVEDPHVGRIVAGKYRVDAAVGAGASGTVYRATHLVLGRLIAIKVLNPTLTADETARARFRREARAASKLDHPNSVQVLDYGIEPDGLTYLAMELLDGRELYRVIYEDWPMGSERIVRVMSQVLSVLAAAHDAGVVHRDLKPENIMLVTRPGDDGRPAETVKVADFGIAKTVSGPVSEESLNLTRDGHVHGTPEYMSPEQARSEEVDGRADLYACGVILYEMMTGGLPFQGDGPFEVILKHLSEPVTPPSARRGDVDRRLEPVVMRALEKKREDRFADARAMRAALLDALEQPVDLVAPRARDAAATPASSTRARNAAGSAEPGGGPRAPSSTIAVAVAPPVETPSPLPVVVREPLVRAGSADATAPLPAVRPKARASPAPEEPADAVPWIRPRRWLVAVAAGVALALAAVIALALGAFGGRGGAPVAGQASDAVVAVDAAPRDAVAARPAASPVDAAVTADAARDAARPRPRPRPRRAR